MNLHATSFFGFFFGWFCFGGVVIIIITFAIVTLPTVQRRAREIGTMYRLIVPSSANVIDKTNELKDKEI